MTWSIFSTSFLITKNGLDFTFLGLTINLSVIVIFYSADVTLPHLHILKPGEIGYYIC